MTPPVPGVVWSVQPPSGLSASIAKAVTDAAAQIPPGMSGGLVAVATEKGVNLAVVHRFGQKVEVMGWIGKSGWSSKGTEIGAQVKAVW